MQGHFPVHRVARVGVDAACGDGLVHGKVGFAHQGRQIGGLWAYGGGEAWVQGIVDLQFNAIVQAGSVLVANDVLNPGRVLDGNAASAGSRYGSKIEFQYIAGLGEKGCVGFG